MSLSCDCDTDCDWCYEHSGDFDALNTKRSRKCCSCGSKISPGDTVLRFWRYRYPLGDIEERIYCDEVPLAPWFMCETCGGLFMAIDEAGMCCDIRENIADQIKEYRSVA